MSSLSRFKAPYGPDAPSRDVVPLSAPASDTPQAGRSFMVLTAGTVSVRTEAGNDRTLSGLEGVLVPTAITHVLAATTADLLIFVD